jgi:hypothetical protein
MKLESVFVYTLGFKLSSGDDGRESLFRCETPVVELSASGYRVAWRGNVRARGVSAHRGMHAAISFFFGCLIRTTPNEIFDLIVCVVAVAFRWGVIRTTPNEIFDLIVCFVAVIFRLGVTLRRRAIAHHRCRRELKNAYAGWLGSHRVC